MVTAAPPVFTEPPDPGRATTLDELVAKLRRLKLWAGDPSYEQIKDRVNLAWSATGRPASDLTGRTTVLDCFRPGRRRLNTDLVVAVVRALHPDLGYVAQWRQALQVVGGQSRAAAQVRVQDTLPDEPAGFTGRAAELDQVCDALARQDGDPVVISAIAGMAGVGKTRLALRAAQQLVAAATVDRVLFVNLRGFHPDPGQPPADPAAVLDGFLRLLGVPGQQIPHDLATRAGMYRERLASTRTLVVLDNAVDADQVRPLLPAPGCPVLVTSRRSLAGLGRATELALGVFAPAEAMALLAGALPAMPSASNPRTLPATPSMSDPGAATSAELEALGRIAHHCGYLPLALGLVAGHIRATPGWSLTDHAERLDERHRDRHLDSEVQLAFDLSYQHLPAQRRRLLRVVALHPGADLDPYAAAALTGVDLATVRLELELLRRDHLLLPGGAARYLLHDLVRLFAYDRAVDEDPPAQRRAALTRLLDHYRAGAARAMDTLRPAETHRRPQVADPSTPLPALDDPDAAREWLDTQRATLGTVAAYAAANGWPGHTVDLAAILFRYLTGGYHDDALSLHGHARAAARATGDPAAEAQALTNLGATQVQLGRYPDAAEQLHAALDLYRRTGDGVGQARALGNLGVVEERLGRFRAAAGHYATARDLHHESGDRTGEARALGNLGIVEARLGDHEPALRHLRAALDLARASGDQAGEASHLNNLGDVEGRLGAWEPAAEHLRQALALFRGQSNGTGEAGTLDSLGLLQLRLGRPERATEHFAQALRIVRELKDPQAEACALNGLGEAAGQAGRAAAAAAHHEAAHVIAARIGDRFQHARAHAGLGAAHLDDPARAQRHLRRALVLYTELGLPQAEEVRSRLAVAGASA